jgi:ParB-like chromosome segregation protein Spo0J
MLPGNASSQKPRQTSPELVIYIDSTAQPFKSFRRSTTHITKSGRRVSAMQIKAVEGAGEGTWVDLGEIAEGPGPYTMSYGFDLRALCESIDRIGMINPPLLARNETGGFDIVSGYRRILALKALGEPKAFSKDVTSALASPAERLLASFYENLATRKFNEIEKGMILQRLQRYVGKDEILASFLPLLSLSSHEGTLEFYLKLLNLEEGIRKAIAQEQISIKAAKALVELDAASQQAVFRWISILMLNINQQLKFIEYAKDISIRDDLKMSELFSDEAFLKIREDPRLNNPQRAKKTLDALRIRRYPRLARAQHAVERAISAVSLPPEAVIRYDPYLEDPNYQLRIGFKDGKALRKTIRELHASVELEAIPELWEVQ